VGQPHGFTEEVDDLLAAAAGHHPIVHPHPDGQVENAEPERREDRRTVGSRDMWPVSRSPIVPSIKS
jgi:hypothetical protein